MTVLLSDNKFTKLYGIICLPASRGGWRGIYDILKSMITRKPLYTFTQKLEISVYAKTDAPCILEVMNVQLEGMPSPWINLE